MKYATQRYLSIAGNYRVIRIRKFWRVPEKKKYKRFTSRLARWLRNARFNNLQTLIGRREIKLNI